PPRRRPDRAGPAARYASTVRVGRPATDARPGPSPTHLWAGHAIALRRGNVDARPYGGRRGRPSGAADAAAGTGREPSSSGETWVARIGDGGDLLKCSFCGKSQKQVKKLIAGPGVYICDECIELCNEIIE